ncbi:hypothetical protein [Thalassospira lohafexi]|uniref:Uncharacterized protein n=1 Tax=Thalassospira lohafexi TaxID=744227 RepID=A0A2N3L0J6_9PROT|nr:hypothetical protein [Thalassospira lohafexi]PKR56331.1 hypothetical protein COO92_21235 [Thalassospira lohafexi]
MTNLHQIAEVAKEQMHDKSLWYDSGVGGGSTIVGGVTGQDIVFWLGLLLLIGRIVIMGFDIVKRLRERS